LGNERATLILVVEPGKCTSWQGKHCDSVICVCFFNLCVRFVTVCGGELWPGSVVRETRSDHKPCKLCLSDGKVGYFWI